MQASNQTLSLDALCTDAPDIMRFIPLEFWNFVLSSTITNKERRILRPIFSFLLLHEQMKVLFFICWPCPLNSEHEITPLFFLLWFLQGYTSLPEMIPRVSCALCVCCYFIDSKLKTYSLVSIIFSNKFGALVFIYFVHITGLTLPKKKGDYKEMMRTKSER